MRGVPLSRQYIVYPCGHCSECKEQRILSWQVRGFHEYIHTQKNNGYVYFLTLTYCDEFLPIMEYTDSDLNLHSISTWNTKHVKNCLKRFRRQLERLGYKSQVRYLLTCERGGSDVYRDDRGHERKATNRPHYHIIMTVNGCTLGYDETLYIFKNSWAHYNPADHTRKTYGNVYNERITRTPQQAIRYVCKYVVKNEQTDLIKKFLPYFVRHNQGLLDGKDMLPRLHVSRYFGVNPTFNALMFDNFGQPSAYFKRAELPNPWDKTGTNPTIPLPYYYQKNYLDRIYARTPQRMEAMRHRASLVGGYYIDPYVEYTEDKRPKLLHNLRHEDIQATRLNTFIDKRIARLKTFLQYFPSKILNYEPSNYLSESLISAYSLTLQRVIGRKDELQTLLDSAHLRKYLFYEYTHFPQVRVTPSVYKHRARCELLHDLNEAYTYYSNVQKQLKRMIQDDKYKSQLPQMMLEHPELFKKRYLNETK